MFPYLRGRFEFRMDLRKRSSGLEAARLWVCNALPFHLSRMQHPGVGLRDTCCVKFLKVWEFEKCWIQGSGSSSKGVYQYY